LSVFHWVFFGFLARIEVNSLPSDGKMPQSYEKNKIKKGKTTDSRKFTYSQPFGWVCVSPGIAVSASSCISKGGAGLAAAIYMCRCKFWTDRQTSAALRALTLGSGLYEGTGSGTGFLNF